MGFTTLYTALDLSFRLSEFEVKADRDWEQNINRNSLIYSLLSDIAVCGDCGRAVSNTGI